MEETQSTQEGGKAHAGLRVDPPRPRPPLARDDGDVLVVFIDPHSFSRECFGQGIEASVREFRVLAVGAISELADIDQWPRPADLVVLNVGSVGVAGPAVTDAIEWLRRKASSSPIIILSDREDADYVVEAIRRGARGFLPTRYDMKQMTEALRFVAAGGLFVPAEALITQEALLNQDANANGNTSGFEERDSAPDRASFERLTPRQREVVALLRLGKPNKIIAHELGMQESTVKVHIRNIMNKMHATNRTQVACSAKEILERR